MARGGNQPLKTFEAMLELPSGFASRSPKDDSDPAKTARAVKWLEKSRPSDQNAWPALTLAFVAQVEAALSSMKVKTHTDLLGGSRILTEQKGKPVRQLILTLPNGMVPTRRYYNNAEKVIRTELNRTHPSMPGHATAGWQAYRDFISLLGSCSPSGRRIVAEWIWEHGVIALSERLVPTIRIRRPRPFHEVVKDLDTASGKTGGAMYQAMVYAYFVADSPTLTVVSHKVNTGSSRAGALGDVDGFLGESIVLAAEAKDKDLTLDDEDDLGGFLDDVAPHADVDAVVFARTFSADIAKVLKKKGIRAIA